MKRSCLLAGALLCAQSLLALGCGAPKPEPEIASSAPQSGYAERYPAELQSTATSFGEREELAKQVVDKLPSYPDELKKPKWDVVLEVVEQADAAGRSYDYVERLRAVDGALGFFNDNKDALTRRVSGAAQYVAKQKGYELDVTGATAHALEEGVQKQAEAYVRERNEAHRRIDRHRASLGKEDAATLEKQADAVSFASYVVHIDLVEQKLRIRRMLEEIDAVKRSIDDAIADERAFQAEGGRADQEKKASEARIEELRRSEALLDSARAQAKRVDETLDERIAAAQKAYREGIDRLKATIRQRGGLPPEPPAE